MSLRWSEEEYAAFVRRGQRQPAPRPMSEDAWQRTVMRVLKDAAYMSFHVHDSRRSPSGWPDVAAIKKTGGNLYLCELKTATGIVSEAQQAWLTALAGCTGVVAEVWRPSMLQEIAHKLAESQSP